MNIREVWLVLKEVKALLPVASLWASLDYKKCCQLAYHGQSDIVTNETNI